jgi:hypothetical protein
MGVLVAFSVFVDGQPAGQLKVNETLTVPVPPGPHKVKVSGGGTFFGIEQDVIVQPNQVHSWKVGYTWMGGIRLTPA